MLCLWHMPVILMLGAQTQVDSWVSLTSKSSLIGKFQTLERSHLKGGRSVFLRMMSKVVL